jgi:hypothetical protein
MTWIGESEDESIEQAIAKALDRYGKVYRKIGDVRAKRVDVETAVETILADGHKETKNVAAPGDYIVTGPGGEEYVVKPKDFVARYEPMPGTTDGYLACGEIIAVRNPLERPLDFVASWGKVQSGAADCMIADMFDPVTRKRAGRPYIIGRAEFEETYTPVSPARWRR